MDSNRNVQEKSGAYIWLRYATQYNRDGRIHTVEMSIPVPIGATPEVREQLIREAEEGMQQFATHMQQREPFITQRTQSSQNASRTAPQAPQPLARTKPTPTPQVVTTRTGIPANRPASQSAPQTSTQSVNAGEQDAASVEKHEQGSAQRAPEQPEHAEKSGASEPRTERPRYNGTGATMTPGENGGMSLPQFIQYIKEHMDLTPKQAMDILNVKSLTIGINLRDALEQLKARTGQSGPLPTNLETPARPAGETERNSAAVANENAEKAKSPSGALSRNEQFSAPIEMRTRRPVSGFDEEIDLEDLDSDEPLDGASSEVDLEDFSGDQFTPRELEQAREKLDALRAIQGAATATDGRLRVLNNVMQGQITNEQLNALILGVWNIPSIKKLKVDQVEELISWAKREDAFIEQVEAILAVLG